MRVSKREVSIQALNNALNQASEANYAAIFEGFVNKGIPEEDIFPRENVFTYNAWQGLNRQVRKGEKGVKVVTYVNSKRIDKETGDVEKVKFKRSTTVFHITQTDPVNTSKAEAAPEQAPAPAKAETAPEQAPAPNASFELGQIFYASWGYEQTNINFYKLISKKGKTTLVFREVEGVVVDQGDMRGKKVPEPEAVKGEVITCRVSKHGTVKIHGNNVGPVPMENGKFEALSFTSYH